MPKVNNVKLLLERTSGAPPVLVFLSNTYSGLTLEQATPEIWLNNHMTAKVADSPDR